MMGALLTDRPAASKGKYLKKITIASTMGPGIKIDATAF
jgi:large subunit ribosomal protein L1